MSEITRQLRQRSGPKRRLVQEQPGPVKCWDREGTKASRGVLS